MRKTLQLWILTVLVIIASVTVFAAAEDYPYPSLVNYADLEYSFNSLARSKILPDYRDYVLNAIKYHIESSESSYRVAKNLLRLYNANEDGNVVFFFDGCSINLDGATTTFSGYMKNGNRYNTSAVCIVLKANASGRPEIVYATADASTMADNVRDSSLNNNTDVSITKDGMYNIRTFNHMGYAALNVVIPSGCSLRCPKSGTSYDSTASGIDIHSRGGYSSDVLTSSTYSSTGCFNVGKYKSKNDFADYNDFIYAVTGVSNARSVTYPSNGVSQYLTVGIAIVDRSCYKTQLATIFGNDNTSGGLTGAQIAEKITEKSAAWHEAVMVVPPTHTHTIDTSYGTNFTAYPKAKITAENIYNENHSTISGAWIGTSDLCTIHEVYTDGCCKVTYPLDAGGSRTVYSKIALFNYSLSADIPTVYSATVSDNSVTVSWSASANAASYDIFLIQDPWSWNDVKYRMVGCTSTSYTFYSVAAGDYCAFVIARPQSNEQAQSNWVGFHVHNLVLENEAMHPHREYRRCLLCGATEYTGNQNVSWNIHYESDHPHREYRQCTVCGTTEYTGNTQTVSTCPECYPITIIGDGITASTTSVFTGSFISFSLSFNGATSYDYTIENSLGETIYAQTIYSPDFTYTFNTVGTYYVWGQAYNSAVREVRSQKITITVNLKRYPITLHLDGGFGSPPELYYSIDQPYGNLPIPNRTGYTFDGWYRLGGERVVPTTNVNYMDTRYGITAHWKANTYTVIYDANGGIGSTQNSFHTYDTESTLTTNEFSKKGFSFLGWSTSPKATSPTYTDGQSVLNLTETNGATVTLYAVWRADILIPSLSVFSPSFVYLSAIPSGMFYAEAQVTNISGAERFTVAFSSYDQNGRFLETHFLYGNVPIGGTSNYTVSFSNKDGKTAKVKAFVWDGMTSMTPLAEAVEFA